jgi:hypothetical protein
MPIGAARFVGLGCAAHPGRHSVELTAYLQDSDSGSVVAVSRDFADKEEDEDEPKTFAELAQASAVKRTSFAALGAGQLLIRGGKRTASFHLLPTRAEVSVQPQAFAWESLRSPVLVEDYAELDARLSALPPASLRPRRVAEDFHVLPVAAVEAAHFDAAAAANDPLGEHLRQLQEGLSDLLTIGLQRTDGLAARSWRERQQQGEAMGLVRLSSRIAGLAEVLERKNPTVQWDCETSGRMMLQLAVLLRMAQDLSSLE